jgi:hypothetical protein
MLSADPPVSAVQHLENGDNVRRVSLDVARDRARLMHDLYASTLDAMHRRYFHGDRAVVPARALEDVFRDVERQNQAQSRWISVSFSAMSINHEPTAGFEQQAARQLADGTEFVEVIENGYYRRAGGIPLTGGCISCHAGFFAKTSPAPKFAGLVISIPVQPGTQLDSNKPTATP